MPAFDSAKVLRELDALRAKKVSIFGANEHHWELAPRLSERDVAAAEAQFGVKLPDDYRRFLIEIGGGGAGPAYGIFPLVRERGTWRLDGDGGDLTGDLATPFPHAEAWNASFEPWDEEAEEEDAYWERRDEWDEELYWHPKQTTGAICICHEGCALRDWLVVTGPQRGMMWRDDRASDGGLLPIGTSFAEWYLAWLAKAARTVKDA